MQRVSDVRHAVDYGYDLAGNRRWATADYLTELYTASYYPLLSLVDSRAYWYKYDDDERMVLSQGVLSGGQIELSQGQGAHLCYDAHGNRAQTEQWEKEGSAWALVTRKHDYDPSDLIKDSYYEKAGIAQRLTTQRFYDTQDRITDYQDDGLTSTSTKSRQQTYYDANGQVRNQTHYDWYNNNWRQSAYVLYYDTSTQARWYDDAGNLKQYQIKSVAGVGTQYTQTFQYGYIRSGGAYQEAQIYGTGQASQGGFLPGTTNQYFTANGFNNPKGQSRVDYQGQIVQKGGAGTVDQNATVQYYAYANGRSIGSYDSWHTVADFDYNYTPVSASYPPSSPGQYVVQYQDTLQKIAYSVYGDASLWYLIADANGLSGSAALATGRMLDIPNVNSNVRNASDTFKPYNPIGDTTPELRYVPPPPPKAACGGLAQILVVVAVVISVLSYGALTELGVGMVAAAAGAAAASSIASQLTANAVGLQDGFSWSAVGKAALAGGLTAGLTNGIASATGIDQISGGIGGFSYAGMAQGALSSTIGQGVNVALGLQEKFSWAGVAAGALVGGYAKGATGDGPLDRAVHASFGNTGTFGQQFAGKLVTGLANRAITVALEGEGKIDFANIAADAFGNALGNSIVGAIHDSVAEKQRAEIEANLRSNAQSLNEQLDAQIAGDTQAFNDRISSSLDATINRSLEQFESARFERSLVAGSEASFTSPNLRGLSEWAANIDFDVAALNQAQATTELSEYIRRPTQITGSIGEYQGLGGDLQGIYGAYAKGQLSFGDAVDMGLGSLRYNISNSIESEIPGTVDFRDRQLNDGYALAMTQSDGSFFGAIGAGQMAMAGSQQMASAALMPTTWFGAGMDVATIGLPVLAELRPLAALARTEEAGAA